MSIALGTEAPATVASVSPAESVPFSVRRVDGSDRTLLTVSGEVDMASSTELEVALNGAVDEGIAEIAVDLSEVVFLDSIGMGVLVTAFIRQARRRHRLVLVAPSPRVRRSLELAGLLTVFPLEAVAP